VESQTDERVSLWIMQAFQRGIAEVYSRGTKLPEYTRNNAIYDFLCEPKHAKKTHMFFLDADTLPINPYAIERLMSLDKDIICGPTPIKRDTLINEMGSDYVPKKSEGFELAWNIQKRLEIAEADKKYNVHRFYDIDTPLPDKPFKIDRTGGTTLLIKRHVLEKLALKHKVFQKTEDNKYSTGVKKSEDYYFSEILQEEGFDIWCDPLTQCRHYHYMDILDMCEVYWNTKKRFYQQGYDDGLQARDK
jgi:hypothetical protein